jgi:hypothetical protein
MAINSLKSLQFTGYPSMEVTIPTLPNATKFSPPHLINTLNF